MATLTGAIAIGYVNRATGKTCAATTAATGYPASNLSNSRLSSSWRSTAGSLTSQNVDVDLGSALDIDVMALVGTNLEDDATRLPVTSENSNYTSPEHNPGSGNVFDASTYPALVSDTGRYGRSLIYFPGSTLNSRYVRLTLNDSGNPDNFLRARVYWVGPVWQPADSFVLDGESFARRRELIGPPGMQRYLTALDVAFFALTEAEGRALESVCSARLTTGRLLVVPRPILEETYLAEAVYCTLTELPSLAAVPTATGLRWKVSLNLREVED